MLGYSSSQSSFDIYQHGKRLESKLPVKYKKEMDCLYDWVKTREFSTAMDDNSKESWLWLKSSMVSPPLKIINKYADLSTYKHCIEGNQLRYRKPEAPSCRLCNEKLANNINDISKFSLIICECDKLWCHVNCADKYCLDYPQCSICKQYFILSPCCSSIRSKFVDQLTDC
jgi:hypothetical protein